MLPSLDNNSARICEATRNNSLLTLYTDLQNFSFFLDINRPVAQVDLIINACTIILALIYPTKKIEGELYFHEKVKFCENVCTAPDESSTVVTSQILAEYHLRGRLARI